MTNISLKKAGSLGDKDIFLFNLYNRSGAFVELTNYGATLVSIVVPDKSGKLGNVILGYTTLEDYFSDSCYLGSTIGRFANRIAGAEFELNGKTCRLDKNDGRNSNHGGFNGFNKKVFDYEILDNTLVLSLKSYDGEGGFPGNIQFSVCYSFSEHNELSIGYKVVSDQATVFNPTNHAYFNLSADKDNVLDHELKIFAGQYIETDVEFIPTGKILQTPGTAFDFSDYRNIGRMALQKKEILKGYNTYFIHPESGNTGLKHLASLKENKSGRVLDVYSTMPGVQVYTGDYLDGQHQPFDGVCLEAQLYPGSPNHVQFPSCVIMRDTEYTYLIKYTFRYLN